MSFVRRVVPAVRRRLRIWRARRHFGELFKALYGRPPSRAETEVLISDVGRIDRSNPVPTYRAMVAAFDHHHAPTPFAVRFGAADVEMCDIGEAMLAIDRADISVSQPIVDGIYEPHLLTFVRSFLKPGMTFVDVGANIGFYSMLAAALVGETGRVLSFEPNSENCRLLLLSASRNGFDNIELHPVALGESAGHAVFRTALGSNGGFIDGEGEALLDPTAMVVPIARLDDVVTQSGQGAQLGQGAQSVDLVKVDVEGAEALVFAGASDLLTNQRPTVIGEFSPEMLGRVSGVDPATYLQRWLDLDYTINVCDRQSHALLAIGTVADFVAGYGSELRIEDLVFIPE